MVQKFTSMYEKFLGFISGALLLFFFGMVFANIICREVIKKSMMMFDELSTYSFVWMVFLSGAVAFLNDAHFKVEILPEKLSKKLEGPLHYLELVILSAYSLIMIYFGVVFAQYNATVQTLTLHLPMRIMVLCIPLSGAFTLISVGLREAAFREQRNRKGGTP